MFEELNYREEYQEDMRRAQISKKVYEGYVSKKKMGEKREKNIFVSF